MLVAVVVALAVGLVVVVVVGVVALGVVVVHVIMFGQKQDLVGLLKQKQMITHPVTVSKQ